MFGRLAAKMKCKSTPHFVAGKQHPAVVQLLFYRFLTVAYDIRTHRLFGLSLSHALKL